MRWDRWIRYLVVCLELNEQDNFRFWVLAQQDPKKFKWQFQPLAASVPGRVGEKIISTFIRKGQPIAKGDILTIAKLRGLSPVYQAKKFDSDTGAFLGLVWVDSDGKEVNVTGSVVVESKHPEARAHADEFWKGRASDG